ncbi:MAG: hypothetical protein QNI87_07190 [Erythrobacter sp.]|uniref:hypothetical protein n=1 Tax=Erythrobacter sp. TaxID=1042 RepID=UPI002617A070|nr:hypothetical protein [Erythrobacter sp.]MDJ0978304.1 hypothetical protein [Erythrobacter sp.]
MASQRQRASMIDYIALSIGHGLLALAFLRLAARGQVDVDPLLEKLRKTNQQRQASRRSKPGTKPLRQDRAT